MPIRAANAVDDIPKASRTAFTHPPSGGVNAATSTFANRASRALRTCLATSNCVILDLAFLTCDVYVQVDTDASFPCAPPTRVQVTPLSSSPADASARPPECPPLTEPCVVVPSRLT